VKSRSGSRRHERSLSRNRQADVSGALAQSQGGDLDQRFVSIFVTAVDGLSLHVRKYGSHVASALPVVCLPGLARTAADFHCDDTGSRSCPSATRVGARLSRSRPVTIRSQSQQLHYSSRTRRPLDSPGRLRDHFGYICRQSWPPSRSLRLYLSARLLVAYLR
jgi:hypothetical protein